MTRPRRSRRAVEPRRAPRLSSFATLAVLLLAAGAQAQLQLSDVSGRVLGPDGAPRERARVTLTDGLGRAIAETASDEQGRFRIAGVAPGVYRLGGEAPALASAI